MKLGTRSGGIAGGIFLWAAFIAAMAYASAPAPAGAPRRVVTKKASKPRMPQPEYLPEAARIKLQERMEHHGVDMMMLTASVLTLSYEDVVEVAWNVALEPKFSRPGPDSRDTLNASLPLRFFDLQDELADRARALAEAARARDQLKMVKAYGKLAETCVTCHSTYFHGLPPSGLE